MIIKEFIEMTDISHSEISCRPVIICEDGYSFSVQASQYHYCLPKTNVGPYTNVELGWPSENDDIISQYAEEPEVAPATVYPYVPIETVDKLLEAHGGIKELRHWY